MTAHEGPFPRGSKWATPLNSSALPFDPGSPPYLELWRHDAPFWELDWAEPTGPFVKQYDWAEIDNDSLAFGPATVDPGAGDTVNSEVNDADSPTCTSAPGKVGAGAPDADDTCQTTGAGGDDGASKVHEVKEEGARQPMPPAGAEREGDLSLMAKSLPAVDTLDVADTVNNNATDNHQPLPLSRRILPTGSRRSLWMRTDYKKCLTPALSMICTLSRRRGVTYGLL